MAKKVEFTSGQNGEVLKNGLLEIARISTFAAENNREIIRRLQAQSPFFKGLTVAQAMEQLRYAEQNGLVERGDGWLAVYHDANETPSVAYGDSFPRGDAKETQKGRQEAAELDERVRFSLGLEAQNRNLLNQNEEYRKIIREQDVQIRDLQRTLTKAGVQIFADTKRVGSFAGTLLRSYGAEGFSSLFF